MIRIVFCCFMLLSTVSSVGAICDGPKRIGNGPDFIVNDLRVIVYGLRVIVDHPDGSPKFSWKVRASEHSFMQSAYQIQVAADSVGLLQSTGLLWNSKKTQSTAAQYRSYQGPSLQSGRTYYWRVKVWDHNGKAYAWSPIGAFQMSLRTAADWRGATWITDAVLPDSMTIFPFEHGRGEKARQLKRNRLPLLRRSFSIEKKLRRATVFMAGLGQFDLFLNGKKVSNHFSDQAWTNFQKEVHYATFDITSQLRVGSNTIGVMLGNGFTYIPGERYRKMTGAISYPKMIGLVQVEFTDGTIQFIPTDAQWQTHPGPIVFSSVYAGEEYDATKAIEGWCTPGVPSSDWAQAITLPVQYNTLKPQMNASLEVMDTFAVKKSWEVLSGNARVYDMGQNASGVPFIKVQGHSGDTIRITPGELLNPSGEVSQRATGSPVFYQYILAGTGEEEWHPQFSFYGFRYLQVQSFSKNADRPIVRSLQTLHTRSAEPQAGAFTCDLPLFNQTNDLILWAIKSNMGSVLMDCPHREKIGWMEQCYLVGNSIRHNFDMRQYFRKSLHDLSLEQEANGKLPEYAPEYVKMDFMEGIFRESPEWGSVAVILPWYLYEWYGDLSLLQEHYKMMQAYTDYLGTRAEKGVVSFGLSDWYDVGPNRSGLTQQTPMGLTATATYYYDLEVMQKVARALGDEATVLKYKATAAVVKKAFHERFYDRERKWYGTGSQTAQAMALYMQLVPDSLKATIMKALLKDLEERNYALTTGDIGFRYLLKVLEEAGRSDIIYKMNNRVDVPGYGYQIAQGATALTESWMASPLVSNNHLMLGHLMEWFYTSILGIGQEKGSVGYQNIVLAPQPVGDIHQASGHYETPYGKIVSSWKKTSDRFDYNVTIPENTVARIVLPVQRWKRLMMDGRAVDMNVLQKVGSGSYQIVVEY